VLSGAELRQRIIDMYGTQAEFSRRVGIPRTSVHRIVNEGLETTSIPVACKICVGLNIPFEELVGSLAGNMSPKEEQELREAKRMYELYLANPDMQPAVNTLLGYHPPQQVGDNDGENESGKHPDANK